MNIENKPIFRFKTREEFLEEFGDDWENTVLYSWDKPMNKWLGKSIPLKDSLTYLQLWLYDIKHVRRGNYSISRDMIKPIEL
jgi:hypothetical protein